MNIPRLVLAMFVGFIIIFGTDFLIHSVWLMKDYEATQAIWRPEAEMGSHIGWMFLAQFLCAATFTIVWAIGFAGRPVSTAIIFAIVMGMFQQTWALVNYVVLPMPGDLAVKWYFSGLVQATLLGIAVALIYRPRQTTAG
jgi:ATP/ADP translocase